jgi:hypothetical protein
LPNFLQASWYFIIELIDVPKKQEGDTDVNHLPPLVWQGSNELISNAQILNGQESYI